MKKSVVSLKNACSALCVFKNNLFNFTETNEWTQPETTGPAPSPRDKLASAVVGQTIYYFGGFGPQGGEEELVSMSSLYVDCREYRQVSNIRRTFVGN